MLVGTVHASFLFGSAVDTDEGGHSLSHVDITIRCPRASNVLPLGNLPEARAAREGRAPCINLGVHKLFIWLILWLISLSKNEGPSR